MKHPTNCPTCGAAEGWATLHKQTFPKRGEDTYQDTRLVFLSEHWLRGDEPVVTWVLCKACGFVCFSPRPDEADLATKYQALSSAISLPPEPMPAIPYDAASWRRADPKGHHRERALDLYETTHGLLAGASDILDYGGAAGALMERFVDEGHRTSVLDYSVRRPLPGVAFAGAEVSNLPASSKFDLIVASHVFEHLADPAKEARALLALLKPSGRLYIEVPCEIWRSAPRPREPVTHTNYFCRTSLRAALIAAGANVIACLYGPYNTYGGKKALSVRSLSKAGPATGETPLGDAEAKALMAGNIQPLLQNWMGRPFTS